MLKNQTFNRWYCKNASSQCKHYTDGKATLTDYFHVY